MLPKHLEELNNKILNGGNKIRNKAGSLIGAGFFLSKEGKIKRVK